MNDRINDYLTVKQAAELVGVCPATLRNWDRAGKFPARRNPASRYRLYSRDDVEKLLKNIEETK